MLAAAGLVGILLLAAALGNLTFAAPYELLRENPSGARGGTSFSAMLRLFVFLFLVIAPLLVFLMVRAPQYRRWMLAFLLLMFLVIYAIVTARPAPPPPVETAVGGGTVEAVSVDAGTPMPTYAPAPEPGDPRVTPAMVWLLSLGLATIILVLAAILYLSLRNARATTATPLEAIAASAETALQALEQGEDVRDTILRCYSSMLAAASQQGVERPGYVTPAEFIQRLVVAGLPAHPVERLTRLFETVRYSPQPPTALMETEATDCLQVVLQAAREKL